MDIKIKKVHPDAMLPVYASEGAACFDLHAVVHPDGMTANIYSPLVVRTGLAFEIPQGYAMLVYSRSGHGFKNDVRLANCVGVIDSDYRGEVLVKLTCDGQKPLVVFAGDRIAQAMIVPVDTVKFKEVEELGVTERGADGFGSTDRKFFGKPKE